MYNSHLLIESNSIFYLPNATISHLMVLMVRLKVDAHRKLWAVEGKTGPNEIWNNQPETLMGHLTVPMISLELGSKYAVMLEYLNFVP